MYLEALASGGGSDWFYTVILKAPLGADITLNDGDEEVNAVGTGDYIGIPVHNASSTYAITVEANGFQRTGTVTSGATSGGMSNLLDYSFGEIDLTIDTDFNGVNATVTDGTSTATVALPATGTSAVIYVPNTGNWTISATDPGTGVSYDSIPNPVPVLAIGTPVSAELLTIPNGASATPTDSIQMWLLCGGIRDKSYTTLGEVLADEETLRRLLTSDNANDYLVRSKTWIGANIIPQMTSNTAPEGLAFTNSSPYSGAAWNAFDRNRGTKCWCHDSTLPAWVGYKFTAKKVINTVSMYSSRALTIKIQGSNDTTNGTDGTWTDLTEVLTIPNASPVDDSFGKYFSCKLTKNIDEYYAYRVYALTTTNNYEPLFMEVNYHEVGIICDELAMGYIGADDYASNTLLSDSDWYKGLADSPYYKKVLNKEVPTMTGASSPEGECEGDNPYSTNYPWKAFDNDNTTSFYENDPPLNPGYLRYGFAKAVKIYGYSCLIGTPTRISSVKFQGTNDKTSTWEDLTNDISTSNSLNGSFTKNINVYRYYQMSINHTGANGVQIHTLQFYGREAGGVQTLLKAAGVVRPYTTLDELLADKEALATVIGSHAAIDYLVTVKDWIDEFTSDQTAMLFIGGDNYAADTLISDEDWASGIAASAYVDYVLNAKVPIMSSDTSPKGRVIYSYQNSTYTAVRAFNTTQNWSTETGGSAPTYIGYIFDTPTVLKYVKTTEYGYSSGGMINNFKIQGSNDTTNGRDGTWTDLTDTIIITSAGPNAPHNFVINNSDSYKAYRLYAASANSGTIGTLQFYGRDDVTEGVHIFSAASDTIYDQNNQVVATTDTSGHALINKANLPNGTYTLRSTVAKDPDNLSNDFTKVVEVTDATKAIFLMPDNTMYWWGFKNDTICEDMSTANGWSLYGSYNFIAPDYQTQKVFLDGNADPKMSGIGSKIPMKDAYTLHVIATGVAVASGIYGRLYDDTSKAITSVMGTTVTSNTMAKYTRTIENRNGYAQVYTQYYRSMYVHAAWYD